MRRQDELAVQAAMISLLTVVREVLADLGAQMALAEKHKLVEALALAGTAEALGVSVRSGWDCRPAGGWA
jgi:hypothetical protein